MQSQPTFIGYSTLIVTVYLIKETTMILENNVHPQTIFNLENPGKLLCNQLA